MQIKKVEKGMDVPMSYESSADVSVKVPEKSILTGEPGLGSTFSVTSTGDASSSIYWGTSTTPATYGTYDFNSFPIDEKVSTSDEIIKAIEKTKLSTLEDVLDDMEMCKNTSDMVNLIAKMQKKVERLRQEQKDKQK